MKIGFHAAHELHPPSDLLELVHSAERAGFHAAMCSDHFHPWTEHQNESGFAWSWLGAALATTGLSYGTVCAPGQRYHPAIIAQAAATLASMFPGRFWLALGTGQNLNEHIDGGPWPDKPRRRARLLECVEVIRALWAGETVDHDGLVRVRRAKLYTRPHTPPKLLGAAITEETAAWVGSWADGLITVGNDAEGLRRVIDAFRGGGGAGKPMVLQAAVSYASSDEEALAAAARHWPIAALDIQTLQDAPMPADLQRAADNVDPESLRAALRISSDLDRHVAWLESDAALGFDAVYLHHVGPDPQQFIKAFGAHVLPALNAAASTA
jgi:coenzyme F420-dependent glucose-6-phosphate dehydrogenase